MHMATLRIPATIAVALLVAATAAAQDFHWTGALTPGKRLEIRGVNGDVRATLAAGAQAEVTARKTARRGEPDEIEIKVVREHCAVVFPRDSFNRPIRHPRRS